MYILESASTCLRIEFCKLFLAANQTNCGTMRVLRAARVSRCVYVGIYSMAYKLYCMAPRVQRVGVTMDPELFDQFKKKCEAEGKRSASSQISELVRAYLGNPDVSALEQIFNLKVEIEQIQRRLTTISRLENGEVRTTCLEKAVEKLEERVKSLEKCKLSFKKHDAQDARISALEKKYDKLEGKTARLEAEENARILKLKD